MIFGKIFELREINYLEMIGYVVFKGFLDYYIEFLFYESKDFRK